ncbi:UDP-4-amino-4,6-dideoxy-N-acetyl-beta-L-altrosamine N-acetyltransferase [Jeotgalibacillus soli]|uniref:GCN5-related N-acetyltransferase n=1 Tax=Jeotgalibacillus soli TaxID=889306 RepID=A0A0C2S7E5_9BACL|nr:UDP-4-amino-4,6-dideoxy-N-acetyl-beta-L-altrosamine N-acetyltransferase [Jeotgalibacillus soli]KIL49939.1 GCN5-related N-acetyltransferase [Jeotgalibacillus soli]
MMKWIHVQEEHLQLVLDWRTSDFVTKYMYTDIEYDFGNQKIWLESIRKDENGHYWLMSYRDALIGFISITSIDWKHKRAYWNFYIGDPKFSMLAGFLGAYMYNYAFNELGFEKLMGEVMAENEAVRKLHVKQGAREIGFFEKHILKKDRWHDIYVYEMTKERWEETGSKFKKYIADVVA